MLLVDAIYINNGGGKILLDYLIKNLESNNVDVFYLLDKRVKNQIQSIKPTNQIIFIEGKFTKRHKFYKINKKQFNKILCFGNVPPSVKTNAEVFTYFHQILFINVPKDIAPLARLIIFAKTFIIRRSAKNTHYWVVQSAIIKQGLVKKYKLKNEEQVLLLPFYNIDRNILGIERKKDCFIYVSSGTTHKNQERLISAFVKFYDESKRGVLHLTISNEFSVIIELIKGYVNKGYPILNHGFIPQIELKQIYQSCAYSIYPSLTESFGMGIIEAIENGCKILGADLPYMHAVCEPSLTFNPFSIEDIYNAFKKAIEKELKPSIVLAPNKINELIQLLK